MAIAPYLDQFDVDPETKQVLELALEMTRTGLGLADDFANGIIAKRIIELAGAGERHPDSEDSTELDDIASSSLRTVAIEKGEPVRFGLGAGLLHAMSGTESRVNPPAAVPYIAVTDT